jgi:NAD(P)-dependent dehydrogenase (short-subunit alcohol dehydrogenase family)
LADLQGKIVVITGASSGIGAALAKAFSIGSLIAHSDKVTPYVASKHALVGFSRGLAKDLAGTGVRVLAVCPHITATDFFRVSVGAVSGGKKCAENGGSGFAGIGGLAKIFS